MDYDKGTWTVDAVWPDICHTYPSCDVLPVEQQFPGGAFRPRIVNLQGHKYLVFARSVQNTFGTMVYRQQGDDWVPSAALIPGKTPGNRPAWQGGWTDAYWWHDANGDGQLQPEEYQDNPTTLPGQLRYWGEQWLDDLSFVKLQAGTPDAWRIAPSGFDKFGNPVYDGKGWKKLLTDTVYAARKAGTADALHGANELESAFGGDWQMIDGSMQEGFTVNARGGPGFDANFAAQYKISRYIPDGKGGFRMKWRVGRTAFGTAQPGQMYGCIFITKPVNGLVGVHDSTAGLYHVYSEDGLFVDTLFADGNRFRPNQAGAYLLQGENFSGTHFLHRTERQGLRGHGLQPALHTLRDRRVGEGPEPGPPAHHGGQAGDHRRRADRPAAGDRAEGAGWGGRRARGPLPARAGRGTGPGRLAERLGGLRPGEVPVGGEAVGGGALHV